MFYHICLILVASVAEGNGHEVVSSATSPTSDLLYQLYNVSSATNDEAGVVCSRCRTGSLVDLQNENKMDFLLQNLFQPVHVSSGRFWLGARKSLSSWKWGDGSELTWSPWAAGHPSSSTIDAEVTIDSPTSWLSRQDGHRLTGESYIVCQYDATLTGQMESGWGEWEDCDYTRSRQVRRRLCQSPASTGCTCEDYQLQYQECTTGYGMNYTVLGDPGVGYMKYEAADMDWHAASDTCKKCSTGSIVLMKTDTDRSLVLGHMSNIGWSGGYYIGLSDTDVDGSWTWLDGEEALWTRWAMFNPSSDPSKVVGMSSSLTLHYWFNVKPSAQVNAVLCQYDISAAGTLGDWVSWGACDGTGTRHRYRQCLSPSPDSTGCSCDEAHDVETEACAEPVFRGTYLNAGVGYNIFTSVGGRKHQYASGFCQSHCDQLPGTLVQYQTEAKYTDVYNNLIVPNGLQSRDHWIALSDSGTEGTWAWFDGTAVPLDWSWWMTDSPGGGYLLNNAILTANVTPAVRSAYVDGSAIEDVVNVIVCEFVNVQTGGTWGDWAPWSNCLSSEQTRTRVCVRPAPTDTGVCQCAGDTYQIQACSEPTSSTSMLTTVSATLTSSLPSTFSTSTATSASTTTTSPSTPTTSPSTATTSPSTASTSPSTVTTSPVSTTSASQSTTSSTTQQPPLSSSSSTQVPSSSTTQQLTSTTEQQSSVSTGSVSTPPTSAPAPGDCQCRVCPDSGGNLTLEEKVAALIARLTIDKHSTSAARRRLVSVGDGRSSSRGIGLTAGILVVGIFIGIIVLFDVTRVIVHGKYVIRQYQDNVNHPSRHRFR